ncbi:type II toxin-antitoxin system VapC family toxin [Corynebacterium sp. Marseille-P4321]|uniref:type II toxin-antitoxin system VapC family toxin n=1 Tax=Corynebacterium sp. Marseille-P4321 TaxID=2736603 RepID=UPI001589F45A|nr:type II toxin-antitoxin system VapC family toxin [Corynebacterium sp. Marseille-P4321]
MIAWYFDTSAALKLLLREAESPQLVAAIRNVNPQLYISDLGVTELRRAAQRETNLTQQLVSNLLRKFHVVQIDRPVFNQAGLLPGRHLRSLDALHVAIALDMQADALIAYGKRMLEAANEAGLQVLSLGA